MDKKVPSAQELVRRMLNDFVANSGDSGSASAAPPPLANPKGFLDLIDNWGSQHPEAAAGLTRAVVASAADAFETLPLGLLLTDVMEALSAFASIEGSNVDGFLELRAPRVVTGPDDRTMWAVLTPVTDRAALVRKILGPVSPRPHPRADPPSVDIHLAEAHHAEELRAAHGLSLRQALEIDERPTAQRAEALFRPLVSAMSSSNVPLGEGLEWLLRNEPGALLAMPTTLGITDALQGNIVPRPEMRLRFAHLLELEGLGFCAFLMWDSQASLTARERVELAGYIRHLSDSAVAPWNRYPDLRRRREAFAIWVRHLREETVEGQGLADLLRTRHQDDYASESRGRTVRRIYRISSQLSGVRLPQGLAQLIRNDREASNATKRNKPIDA